MEQAFTSWSGGKDCCLACYRASSSGLQIRYLVNMMTDDGQRSRSHGLATRWLQMQAEALGIPLVQRAAGNDDYEAQFKGVLRALKQDGITAGVFGDIDFNAHREWVERVCADAGIKPYLPLWQENQAALMREFIDSGFTAVVVAVKAALLGADWLGRTVDHAFLADLARLDNITPCGEAGEYHTLVVDGPIFNRRLDITGTGRVQQNGHWLLDIVNAELKSRHRG
ncbi:MAG: diphthine--ammonia ligase [Chloroflexi bacterium]|nr:diphthine--ammonia ligase [Chloroflexota bacterium]